MSSSITDGTPTVSLTTLTHANAPSRFLSVPAEWWLGSLRFTALVVQLSLIALVLYIWQIDNRAFRYQYAYVICIGFVINHFLPATWRLPFFAILSLVSTTIFMGWHNAGYIFAIGGLMIAIAHLPVAFAVRLGLLAIIGVVLMFLRANTTLHHWTAVWPIVGSMFMFRMLVYLHDMRTGIAPVGLWHTLAYFFMLPNAFFPLFPLVDYKSFTRTHYNRHAFEIYQKGVDWILRGILQLILYRFVYQKLVLDPHQVADAGDLARYLVSNFLLYLRVSGYFHLIVGILHLFGFNLSETHHRYLLASSFTDFWRRINIYWKDFIQKMFFFPVYFRVKKRGETFAIVIATLLAFFVTWLLHIYQWFWLRGGVMVHWQQDVVFWSVLALGVLINVLQEAKNTRQQSIRKLQRTWKGELSRALRTISMFVFICLLWSLWNAQSWSQWLDMLSRGRYLSLSDAAWILGGLFALGIAAITMGQSAGERGDAPAPAGAPFPEGLFWKSALVTGAAALALVLVGKNPLWFASMPEVVNTLESLKSSRLNAQDIARLERGYYEDLLEPGRMNTELAELYSARPLSAKGAVAVMRDRDDQRFPTTEYIPNARRVEPSGLVVSINRFGMRDRDYTLEKPSHVYRIALLGDSNSAGNRISDDQLFEHLVEERLNADSDSSTRYEILNFAVASYGPYARLLTLQNKVLAFQPDAVLCIAENDLDWMLRDISTCLKKRLPIPDPFVAEIVQRSGATTETSVVLAEHLLTPNREKLVRWTYQKFADTCRAHGMLPLAAFLPRLVDREWEQNQLPQLIRAAEDAGSTVLNLTSAFDAVENRKDLWLGISDDHPNPRGNELIAELLYTKLQPIISAPRPSPDNR